MTVVVPTCSNMTVKEIKDILITELGTVSDAPAFEANEIIIDATEIERSSIVYQKNTLLTSSQLRRIKKSLSKRKKGYPLQYILGEWEFYSLPFKVGRGVLIPRPDTELLVELALEELAVIGGGEVLDLCAGSGAIGIAVAKNCGDAKVTLVEKSKKAYSFLRENINLNRVKVKPVRADIFHWAPDKKADLLLCNPPYIDKNDMKTLEPQVKKEPITALFGGNDGLKFYRFLTANAEKFLNSGGKMMVEIGFSQGALVKALFDEAGFENTEIIKDLSGNDRVVVGTYTR